MQDEHTTDAKEHEGTQDAATSLTSLFAEPPANNTPRTSQAAAKPAFTNIFDPPPPVESTPRTSHAVLKVDKQPALANIFDPPPAESTWLLASSEQTPKQDEDEEEETNASSKAFDVFKASNKRQIQEQSSSFLPASIPPAWKDFIRTQFRATTFIGAFMFLLYHVVFCLAMGSAIPHVSHPQKPLLGVMAKYSAVGILFAGPVFVYRLNSSIPAVYPSIDLFLAPFLAEAARQLDSFIQVDLEQQGQPYPDAIFLATFAVWTSLAMLLAAILLTLAATFKLANLGSYLPYSVLCGFFSAVGVLLWALAFQVDTGHTWQQVVFGGETSIILPALAHHAPSLAMGILMNRLGPKNPFLVLALLLVTQICFWLGIWISGSSLEQAQNAGWFWSSSQLIYDKDQTFGFADWTLPPAPLGSILCLIFNPKWIQWRALLASSGNAFALAFLYLLRSSIHASAMRKNVSNLVRRVPHRRVPTNTSIVPAGNPDDGAHPTTLVTSLRQSVKQISMSLDDDFLQNVFQNQANGNNSALSPRAPPRLPPKPNKAARVRQTSENLDIDDMEQASKNLTTAGLSKNGQDVTIEEIRPPKPDISLEGIFQEYAYALYVSAFFGGSASCPTVATSNTMYAIGAEHAAPQYGSVLLLLGFYLTNFSLVQYIPKSAFSSLLILGAVDTFVVWWFGSFQKTLDKSEWAVVPFIVAFSLIVGFLNAVFIGVAISTLIFVGAFFRVGVVKFRATGCEVRSSIERPIMSSDWLDEHGNLLQVIVLQNYLFFGNANSILNYVGTMFEELDAATIAASVVPITPKPKVLILDLSLTTGMDTSTVDVFKEINQVCKANACKIYVCGVTTRLRRALAAGGFVADSNPVRNQRMVRYFPDLDAALGKAEDTLLRENHVAESKASPGMASLPEDMMEGEDAGFRYALLQIDEQHEQNFALDLLELEKYTRPVELEPGQCLFESQGGPVSEQERGLFFVESGLLKIEKDASTTLNRSRGAMSLSRSNTHGATSGQEQWTLGDIHARLGEAGNNSSSGLFQRRRYSMRGATKRNFRLARLGPGWVCGTAEMTTGRRTAGVTIAVTECRLHHLPFSSIRQLEETNPRLVLKLYQMLSHLMARHQDITIEQLATLHSIMSSPAQRSPFSRASGRM